MSTEHGLAVVFALAGASAVSLVSLCGAFVTRLAPKHLEKLVPMLVALAVGVLLGDAFIHLIPDAIERQGSVPAVCLTVLLGVFGFFVLEKLVRWRHDHHVPSFCAGATSLHGLRPLARMNLIGDAVHNFVDGVLIGGSFLVDPALGLTTTLAIIAHEIPQEIGDVGALITGGLGPSRAVVLNFYCSLTVLAGVAFVAGMQQVAESSLVWLLPVAAGGFIYIAASDLIPSLQQRSALGGLIAEATAFAIGIGVMQGVAYAEPMLSI